MVFFFLKRKLLTLRENPLGFKTITKSTASGGKEPQQPPPPHSPEGGAFSLHFLKICLMKN
jgi:hypothetical protein